MAEEQHVLILQDPEQKLARALCAEVAHAPPHVFIFDAEGRLRYAGEFADGWMEPAKIKRVYLVEALERVLAKQYAANGALFYAAPLRLQRADLQMFQVPLRRTVPLQLPPARS